MESSSVDVNWEGDHICSISDLAKIQAHDPQWQLRKSLDDIFTEIVRGWGER
jgi:CDP-paratose 2-epimerase